LFQPEGNARVGGQGFGPIQIQIWAGLQQVLSGF
jgi:hypothetical protein